MAESASTTGRLTMPIQLGVEYNTHIIEAILTEVAPPLGWR